MIFTLSYAVSSVYNRNGTKYSIRTECKRYASCRFTCSYGCCRYWRTISRRYDCKERKLTLREMTYIRSQNGVGDILGQFYNTNGDLLELSHHNRLIGTPLYFAQYESCRRCCWRYRKDRCNLWCLKRKVYSYINYR